MVWDRPGAPPYLVLRHEPHGQYDKDVAKIAAHWGVDLAKVPSSTYPDPDTTHRSPLVLAPLNP